MSLERELEKHGRKISHLHDATCTLTDAVIKVFHQLKTLNHTLSQTDIRQDIVGQAEGIVPKKAASTNPTPTNDSPVNTVPDTTTVSMEDIRVAARELSKKDGNDNRSKALLKKFGVSKLKELKPDRYTDFFNALLEAAETEQVKLTQADTKTKPKTETTPIDPQVTLQTLRALVMEITRHDGHGGQVKAVCRQLKVDAIPNLSPEQYPEMLELLQKVRDGQLSKTPSGDQDRG
jgi:hypothetical protein